MFNTHYLGKIKKHFWETMDDHVGARVVFKFFFPLLKKNARRIKDAYAMTNWLIQNGRLEGATKERLKELRTHLRKGLPTRPKEQEVQIRHGFPPEIFEYELDENSADD